MYFVRLYITTEFAGKVGLEPTTFAFGGRCSVH